MNINEFRSALQKGGARSNLFKVKITNPSNASADSLLPFMCKAASLPQKTINPINASFLGRQVKLAGVTQNYEDWNITVYNDETFQLRNAFEQWQNDINSPEGNSRRFAGSEPSLYKSTAEIIQLNQKHEPIRTYKMIGVWPTTVGEITTDWGQEDIETFQVTMCVDYWYPTPESITGSAGGFE